MKIVPIFDPPKDSNDSHLWTVCYPEDRMEGEDLDIFSKLFDLWNDTTYLQNFFTENIHDLIDNPFWNGISISNAIDKVIDESLDFQQELLEVEHLSKSEKVTRINAIFKNLHNDEFIVLKSKDENFKKGKPDIKYPMLRLYGILLEDDCIIITGGAIKLTEKMNRAHLEFEIKRLRRVKDFLQSELIYDKNGFIE